MDSVCARHMQKFMDRCCILAHPDLDHHLRHVTKAVGTNGFDPSSTSIHVPKEWRKAPMAFICGDFVFLATNNQCIDDYRAIQPPSSILPARIWSLITRLPTILFNKRITGLGISSVR
jgi:hypothetical protein